eukprot:757436-Hanusia_phi.AAC.15
MGLNHHGHGERRGKLSLFEPPSSHTVSDERVLSKSSLAGRSLKRCRFAFTDDDLQPPAPDEHSRGKKTTALKTDDKTLSMLREELLRAGGSSEAVEKLLKKLAGKKSDCDGGQTDQTEDACSFKGEARQFVTVRTDPEARERGTMGYIVLSDHLDRKRELSSLLLSRLNVIHKDGKPWALRPDCELVADLRTFWEMMQVMSNGEFLKGGEEAEVKRADKEAEVWKEAAWLCKSGKEISAVCPSECLTLCSFTWCCRAESRETLLTLQQR